MTRGTSCMKHFHKKHLIAVLILLAAIAMMLAAPMGIHADFGDFAGNNDYGGDWGGNDDWGGDWGGDDDWDSSSSGSDDDLFSLFFFVYSLFGMKGVVVFLIIIAVLYFLGHLPSGSKPKQKPVNTGAKPTDRADLRPMSAYTDVDPSFDQQAFSEKLSNLYVQLQNGWQAKDISGLRPYLTDALYAQSDRQLERYRSKGQTNHIDRISVLSVDLVGWKQTDSQDVVIAELRTRIVDYVTDDATGTVVRGSDTREKFMTYEWTLVRTTGTRTSESTGTTGQTCPFCGAHVDINHSAVCEYCGSVLTTDSFDWVISNIKGLSQQTK